MKGIKIALNPVGAGLCARPSKVWKENNLRLL